MTYVHFKPVVTLPVQECTLIQRQLCTSALSLAVCSIGGALSVSDTRVTLVSHHSHTTATIVANTQVPPEPCHKHWLYLTPVVSSRHPQLVGARWCHESHSPIQSLLHTARVSHPPQLGAGYITLGTVSVPRVEEAAQAATHRCVMMPLAPVMV